MPVTSANDPSGSSKKSPLDHYLQELGEGLPEYSVDVAMICASPLPEKREEVFILASAARTFPRRIG